MKRYIICPVVTEPPPPPNSGPPSRKPLAAHLLDVAGVDNNRSSAIHPTLDDWCLTKISATTFGPIMAHPDIYFLPDLSHDVKVSAMHKPTRDLMKQQIASRGVVFDVEAADGYREVIRAVGKGRDTNFHEDQFDCSEI